MKVTLHRLFVRTTLTLVVLLCVPCVASAQNPHGVKTIVIDPGHGGTDAGCVWGKTYEKDIVLAVGLQLGEMINKNLPDVKVAYTRKKDVAVDLGKRGELANKMKADLFISIHVNSSDYKKGANPPSGTETFVMGAKNTQANLALVMRENDVIVYEDNYKEKYEGYEPGSPESFIIFSLMQYVNTDQSINLAQTIQKQYNKNVGFRDRGVKQASLIVLWKTTMPSVLTEIGFINNPKEREYMCSKAGQKKIATSLFNAISEYKAKLEGNSKPVIIDASHEPATTVADAIGSPITPAAAPEPRASAAQSTKTATTKTAATSDKWTFGSSKVVYRVQIYSLPKKLSLEGRELRPFRGRVTQRKSGNNYKYYVGGESTYTKALELQKEVRKTVKDAFLVAFDGDKQITIGEARKLER